MDKDGQIRVPRTNASDDSVVLREWCVDSGSEVEAGQVVAYCESSKTVFELEAPRDGFLHYRLVQDDTASVGETVAFVSEKKDWAWPPSEDSSSVTNVAASKSALAHMQKHGISPEVFADRELVTKADVDAYLASQNSSVSGATESSCPEGNRVVVIGGSGHAKTCIEILKSRRDLELAGILDDGLEKDHQVMGLPVLGTLEDMSSLARDGVGFAVLGIGSLFDLPARLKLVARAEQAGLKFLTIIHPSAVVEPSASLGQGVQIHAGAVVSADTVVHDHAVINTSAVVSHDCVIERNAHIAPGAILAGAVKVGCNALVGMGTTVFIGVTIGDNVVINNGQNIFNDHFEKA